jgi:hypothetical protein
LKRLASLRQLAKRTFPEHEYDRLSLCSRLVEAGPSSASTLETAESHNFESLAITPDAVGTAAHCNDEAEQENVDLVKRASASLSPRNRDPKQLSDGPDVAGVGSNDRSMITAAVPASQGISITPDGSVYAATLEAALSNNYQDLKRTETDGEDSRDMRSQKAAGEATDDNRQESTISIPEPQIQNRVSLVNWEDEWDGGAFAEGEDAE